MPKFIYIHTLRLPFIHVIVQATSPSFPSLSGLPPPSFPSFVRSATASSQRARTPFDIPERDHRPEFDAGMEIAEEDIAHQVSHIAGVAPEMGHRFDELGAENPQQEGEEPAGWVEDVALARERVEKCEVGEEGEVEK